MLLFETFACWLPNTTVQPNVSTITPRSLTTRPRLHAPNQNTTVSVEAVACIRPLWPNSTSISCLSASTAITCPYTDAYRGNATALAMEGEEYINRTTARCTIWPLLEVYRHVADRGLLFSLPANANVTGYKDPWELPSDAYTRVAVGTHHYCAIDHDSLLRCTGHNADGRASLRWPATPEPSEHTTDTQAAIDAAVETSAALGESPGEAKVRLTDAIAAHAPPRVLDFCAGYKHTCAIEEFMDHENGNVTGSVLRCWGSNYSGALDVGAVTKLIANQRYFGQEGIAEEGDRGDPQRIVCGSEYICVMQRVIPANTNDPPELYPYCTGLSADREGGKRNRSGSTTWPCASWYGHAHVGIRMAVIRLRLRP
mmetsp:Transcript_33453/g.66578  ORF Transcript_33453/g.66578 Transcript_33453/m.66578 type:complete len:370 (-) Transcript_33453:67-1176(-)